MGHRDWPKLNVLKADYCEARGLDPALTVVELHRPGGVWAVKGHMVIAEPLVGLGFDVEAAVIDEPCGCPEREGVDEAWEKYFAERSGVEQDG
jgi:hypothetical protein